MTRARLHDLAGELAALCEVPRPCPDALTLGDRVFVWSAVQVDPERAPVYREVKTMHVVSDASLEAELARMRKRTEYRRTKRSDAKKLVNKRKRTKATDRTAAPCCGLGTGHAGECLHLDD